MSGETEERGIEVEAVKHVEQGENTIGTTSDTGSSSDKEEFIHSVVTYVTIAVIMFFALAVLTLFDTGTADFWINLLQKIDTLNLMFSLVLSAALEQMWNNKRALKFKITMILELVLASLGFIWFFARSFANIMILHNNEGDPYIFESFFQNKINMLTFNTLYIIIGTIVIIFGFAFRVNHEID